MDERPQTRNPNPNSKQKNPKNKNSNSENSVEFEFCKVCNHSHNQRQRHKYFPSHTKSLSNFLSKFETKLSDIRFFLKNPTSLRIEHSDRNRLWCVFCDFDIDELGSTFACCNVIRHLASSDHLKSLKSFLWKHGGGMDRIDSFSISESDFNKWDKKCATLKKEAALASVVTQRNLIGPVNDIHNELDYKILDDFNKNIVQSPEKYISNGVLPLQNYTNENCQVLNSQLSEVAYGGHGIHTGPIGEQFTKDVRSSNYFTGSICSRDNNVNDGEVHLSKRMATRGSSSHGVQPPNPLSSISLDNSNGNVHSGAPPPWFEANELSPTSRVTCSVSRLSKPGKSNKLNPKRVGAAWAEKRKIELELERRGEIVAHKVDDNWLPNFGRVWQSGSRKESRKEFEMEKQKSHEVESQTDMSVKIQPYISKRMRIDGDERL